MLRTPNQSVPRLSRYYLQQETGVHRHPDLSGLHCTPLLSPMGHSCAARPRGFLVDCWLGQRMWCANPEDSVVPPLNPAWALQPPPPRTAAPLRRDSPSLSLTDSFMPPGLQVCCFSALHGRPRGTSLLGLRAGFPGQLRQSRANWFPPVEPYSLRVWSQKSEFQGWAGPLRLPGRVLPGLLQLLGVPSALGVLGLCLHHASLCLHLSPDLSQSSSEQGTSHGVKGDPS